MKKYISIAYIIENNIAAGKYDAQKKLPTEEEFIREFNVSRNTVRKAIDLVVKKGLVIPIQGSGVFLRDVDTNGAINLENFLGLSRAIRDETVSTRLLELKEINADPFLASKLKCALNQPLYAVTRLRFINGDPYVIEYSYFNKRDVTYLDEKICAGSIYAYFRETLHLEIGYVERVISADRLQDQEAQWLGCELGSPALKSENTAMTKSGQIFEYSVNVHHYKRSRFLKLSNFN